MGTENRESCSQRDSAERKGYVRAHRSFNRIWKERDSAEPDILGKILDKDNLNRAYKRVKANKGAPGIDGMTIEAALPWLREHNHELTERIRKGKIYPVSCQTGGNPEAGRRSTKAWHSDRHRPHHPAGNAHNSSCQSMSRYFRRTALAIVRDEGQKTPFCRIKEYMQNRDIQGQSSLDLSKYFDTLNHTILLNLLRKQVKDERVIQMVKRYLKSGVMENGVVTETEGRLPTGRKSLPTVGKRVSE